MTALGTLRDPRYFQIATLSSLLLYGVVWRGVAVEPAVAAAILITALTSQYVFSRYFIARRPGQSSFDPKSPLISGLSLCLLLRTIHPAVGAAAALAAIASKFLLRRRGKHIFNPANFGLILAVVLTGQAWISPGQWGNGAFFALIAGGVGSIVVSRSARSDVTLAFLGSFAAVLFGRALWLGDPLTIPVHQLQNGALLIFAFFMISDPKTTPDSRAGRILYGALIAAVGAFIQFGLHQPNGPIWALVGTAPLVPLLDRRLPALRFQWPESRSPQSSTTHNSVSTNLQKELAPCCESLP